MIWALAGVALCLAAWGVLRQGVGARALWRVPPAAALLDAAPVTIGFAAVLGATARPLVAGVAIGALAAGLSLADRVKRVVLDEPVVFADRAELFEVVRHPSLYLPFAGSAWVLAAIGAAIVAFAILLGWVEPPLWTRPTGAALEEAVIGLGLAYGCLAVPAAWPAALRRLAGYYTARLSPSRDPVQDAAALGPLACLAIHATLAAAERPSRRAAAAELPAPARFPADAGPVVLVQAESFVDPAQWHPELAGILPHYAVLAAEAVQRGRLDVPAWGANTVRTEFEVLTGLRRPTLGLDCFNPYEAFALAQGPRLPSIARMAAASGYRTVFVHPFDLRFYSRQRVLPRLGFDELVGPAAFAGARRRGDWVADEAIPAVVADVLRRHGPRVFVFVATMEAHGPWDGAPKPAQMAPLPAALQSLPEAAQLARWLWHLQGTDRMLRLLADQVATPRAGGAAGWLALYGDHPPSLPRTVAGAGVADRRTDYMAWCSAPAARPLATQDIAAHQLGSALVAAMAAAR